MYRVRPRVVADRMIRLVRFLWGGCSECGRAIKESRRQSYPHVKTCSPECSSRRERRLGTKRQRRFRKRRKQEQRHKENAQ